MSARYRWKEAMRLTGDAQLVGETLEEIRRRHNGRLANGDVLDEAKKKTSPLHKYFDWDNNKAAQKWRVEQAGQLIRAIEVVVEIKKGENKSLRAFVSVTRDRDRSYTSLSHAMSDAELRQQVLARAYEELRSWRERYDTLSEFAKLFAVIDRMKPTAAKKAV